MRVGCCAGWDQIPVLQKSEADYIEMNLSLIHAMSEETFKELLRENESSSVKVKAFNCFLPSGIKVTGEKVDEQVLHEYACKALDRAARLNGEVVVFGSGAARAIPEGFDHEKAKDQLVRFLRMVSDLVKESRIVVAIEPLRKAETNLIHTLGEAAAIARLVDRQEIRILSDLFHMEDHHESMNELVTNSELLTHVHIANPIGRGFPFDSDEYDYTGFFTCLRRARYQGRISIEGRSRDLENDLPKSVDFIRKMICSE
jgi:D-psicose/D-tagatose/L-ribulose 3-epimerase